MTQFFKWKFLPKWNNNIYKVFYKWKKKAWKYANYWEHLEIKPENVEYLHFSWVRIIKVTGKCKHRNTSWNQLNKIIICQKAGILILINKPQKLNVSHNKRCVNSKIVWMWHVDGRFIHSNAFKLNCRFFLTWMPHIRPETAHL